MIQSKPNFFIIGAPKCGTTSLSRWLREHPNIYMSPVKEPFFFCTDIVHSQTLNPQQYQELFLGVDKNHQAIGEASNDYLYSQEAILNIQDYAPDARFVVMLRNPVDMIHAWHQEQLFHRIEVVEDFEEAWNLQPERASGKHIPAACTDRKFLDYTSWGMFGEQMERLYQRVDRSRVLVLLLDDIRLDARKEYLKVLNFLGVPDDGRVQFPVHNSAKKRRLKSLVHLSQALLRLKLLLGIKKRWGYLNALKRWNSKSAPRTPLRPEFRARLENHFADDISKLGTLIQRDLSHWLARQP